MSYLKVTQSIYKETIHIDAHRKTSLVTYKNSLTNSSLPIAPKDSITLPGRDCKHAKLFGYKPTGNSRHQSY